MKLSPSKTRKRRRRPSWWQRSLWSMARRKKKWRRRKYLHLLVHQHKHKHKHQHQPPPPPLPNPVHGLPSSKPLLTLPPQLPAPCPALPPASLPPPRLDLLVHDHPLPLPLLPRTLPPLSTVSPNLSLHPKPKADNHSNKPKHSTMLPPQCHPYLLRMRIWSGF